MTTPSGAVFLATSLDGFIARPDGGLDWLPGAEGTATDSTSAEAPGGEAPAGPAEDFGFQAFLDSVDVIVMGRKTFAIVEGFDGWFYGDTPLIVWSQTLSAGELREDLRDKVSVTSSSLPALFTELGAAGIGRVYVDGGQTVQEALRHGLIDELTISRIPVLLGEGIPLFGPLPGDVWLNHLETKTFPGGMVQSKYGVVHRGT